MSNFTSLVERKGKKDGRDEIKAEFAAPPGQTLLSGGVSELSREAALIF